jgi:TetR/AcrR family transcriptional regulator, repressor of fatR-cypB operon
MSSEQEQNSPIVDSSDGSPDAAHPRDRILKAALELFVEQGYFNTNVPNISSKSKCSVGSIYHHFINKEEIAFSLYRDGIIQFRNALENSISSSESDPLEKTIRSIVIAFLAFAEEHKTLSRYLWLARHNEFLESKIAVPTRVGFDSFGRKLTKTIKSAIRNNEIPPVKAEVFWSIVFGIPLSFVRDWLEGYTASSPKEVSHVLASACWAAIHEAH